MNSIIIRHTDNAQKIIETLKAKGQLKTSVVLEKDIELKRIVGIDTDIVFIEAENNYSTLIAVTTFLGWKKFRLFAFDLTDGIDYAKFFIVYGENCFESFPNFIFNKNFTIEKFENYMNGN